LSVRLGVTHRGCYRRREPELWLPAGVADIRLAVIAGRTCAADIVP